MDIDIRFYLETDLDQMTAIWNQVVEEGTAFPQTKTLSLTQAKDFFREQTCCGVAVRGQQILGLYILHPNNIGRCGHIGNASYAVDDTVRSLGIGEKLVLHSIKASREAGFRLLQFNAVVASNQRALRLYEKLGFTRLGVIPGGFRLEGDRFEDIVLFYIETI